MLWAGSQCKNKKAQKVFLKGSLLRFFVCPKGFLVLKKLLASGMTAEEILAKLQ